MHVLHVGWALHPWGMMPRVSHGTAPLAQKMVAMSSLFCVSGICDFVVSTFFVMKSKWYPICLGENVQTTAKLHVVRKKKKIFNLFAVNRALNDRVGGKCTQWSLPVCSDTCVAAIHVCLKTKSWKVKFQVLDLHLQRFMELRVCMDMETEGLGL